MKLLVRLQSPGHGAKLMSYDLAVRRLSTGADLEALVLASLQQGLDKASLQVSFSGWDMLKDPNLSAVFGLRVLTLQDTGQGDGDFHVMCPVPYPRQKYTGSVAELCLRAIALCQQLEEEDVQPLECNVVLDIRPQSIESCAAKPGSRGGSAVPANATPPACKERNPREPPVQIFVQTLTGKLVALTASRGDSILDIKNMRSDMGGPPADQSRLIFNGKQLQDSFTLAHYNIQRESTLHELGRLRGGMFHQTSGRDGAFGAVAGEGDAGAGVIRVLLPSGDVLEVPGDLAAPGQGGLKEHIRALLPPDAFLPQPPEPGAGAAGGHPKKNNTPRTPPKENPSWLGRLCFCLH